MRIKNISSANILWIVLSIILVGGLLLIFVSKSNLVNTLRNEFIYGNFIPGEVVVGFRKEVTANEAVGILNGLGLRYVKTNNVNVGKIFFYNTGERFLLKVNIGEEQRWINKLQNTPQIYDASRHINSQKVLVD